MDFMSKVKDVMKSIKNMDRNAVLVCIAIIAIVITGVLIFVHSNTNFSFPSFLGKSDSQVGNEVISYINTNQLSQTPASLVKASEVSGLVKVTIKIGTNQFDSYASKDGKFLFPQALDMTAKTATPAAAQNTNANTPAQTPVKAAADIQKVATPVLEAYVVSSCPYGLQMQRAFADAVKSVPSLASNVILRYIGSVSGGTISSMHGPEEAAENLRQICLRQEQPSVYWNYVSCYMKKTTATSAGGMPLGDSPSCQASTGVNIAKLASCVSDPTKGLAYAQKDFSLATKYSVQGSPTLILDGTQIDETNFGGRSSDAIKTIICDASQTKPSFCSKALNTAEAAVSFSTTYASGSSASSSAANCNTAQ